jgi:hypothetical protein
VAIAQGLIGDAVAAIAPLTEVIHIRRARHELLNLPVLLAKLADFQLAANKGDDAIATINEAITLVEQTGERQIEAALYRRRGDAFLLLDPSAAETAFEEAIRVARQQGARTFELEAALPLARLLQSTGRSYDAYAVLAPALEGFAPTLELPAIAEAQALLQTLRPPR